MCRCRSNPPYPNMTSSPCQPHLHAAVINHADAAYRRHGCRSSVQVTRKVSVPLKVTVTHHGIQPLTAERKKASQELLAMFEKREKEKRALEKARNELESYIVNTRSQLSDGDIISVWPAAAIGQYFVVSFSVALVLDFSGPIPTVPDSSAPRAGGQQ
jgi:molybdopterin converting factor small subunit